MNLYVLRHGIAEERRAGLPDARRALTTRGIKRIRKIARAMKTMDLQLDTILSSPYARSRRTASIVGKALSLHITIAPDLRPGTDPRAVIAALRARQDRNVLLVGHEPMLSQLASVLLAGTPAAAISIKKGGLCKLRTSRLRYGRCATLEWLLAPRQMFRLR